MRIDKLILFLAWVGLLGYWLSPAWAKHARAAYEKYPETSFVWLWLRVFEVPHTRENCFRVHKWIRALGVTLTTVAIFGILIWGE